MKDILKKLDVFHQKEEKEENNLDIGCIPVSFTDVLHGYIWFLLQTFRTDTNDEQRELRKYDAIRKELFDFLVFHKTFFEIKHIKLLSKGDKVFHTMKLDVSTGFEQFLKRSDFAKFDLQVTNTSNFKVMYGVHIEKKEIVKILKKTFRIEKVTNKCVKLILKKRLLDNNEFILNLSYKKLSAYIKERGASYLRRKVSKIHIKNMSLKFNASIECFEDEISCPVCLEDYIKDQKVCKLPCSHLLCKKCAVEVFKRSFQCPICRDDCT